MWKHLKHPNIVPLLGVTTDPFQLISEWVPSGDLPSYIGKDTGADRLGLVGAPAVVLLCAYSYHKLSDVAEGLCYLHSRNMVHGDLKGVRGLPPSHFTIMLTPGQPNILVDDSGHARITDFGQAKVTQSLDTIRSASRHGNTPRWAAPEILDEQPPSREADVFSFAMVMIEVCRG